jgi:ketosteroid isomerase-like protein
MAPPRDDRPRRYLFARGARNRSGRRLTAAAAARKRASAGGTMQPGFVRLSEQLVEAFALDDSGCDEKRVEGANVRRLASFYAAIAADDYPAAVRLLHPESSYAMYSAGATPFRMAGRGLVEVEDGIRRNFGVMTFDRVDIESLAAQGELVLMVLRQRGHWRHNGDEFDERALMEFRFRDGALERYRAWALPYAP